MKPAELKGNNSLIEELENLRLSILQMIKAQFWFSVKRKMAELTISMSAISLKESTNVKNSERKKKSSQMKQNLETLEKFC